MKKNSLKKNILYNIIYQLLVVILPLITSPYVSRRLGAEMSGVYAYTYSIAYYFMMFGRLGIVTYGNRCIAKVRDNQNDLNRTFSSLLCFQLVFSIIMIILYIFYTISFVKDNHIIYYIHLTAIIANMIDITWLFFGIEEFKLTLSRNILVKLISFFCILLFVKDSSDLWIYTLIMGGSTLLGQLITWTFLKGRVKIIKPKYSEIIVHLKPNLVLFIPSIAISIFQIMDKIMLGNISAITQVGFYEYAEKIISVPKSIITALGTAMLPRMTNMFAKGEEKKSKEYIKNTMFYVSIITPALVFGLMSVSNIFAPVYWGYEYIPCAYLIIILSPGVIFSVIGNVIRTQYLIPKSRDKEYVISLIAGAVINLIGNIILIPRLGAIGASISTVLAEFLMTFIQIYVVRTELPFKDYLKNGYKYFIIGIIMFICNYLLSCIMNHTVLNLFILIIIGGIIYVGLILCVFKFSKNETEIQVKNQVKEKIKKVKLCRK